MRRRSFIKKALPASILISSSLSLSCNNKSRQLNILILGGTYFVGPAIVRAALQQNHKVTLFNRGITNPSLYPELRHIKGDREQGGEAYNPLLSEQWDVVIDVWPEKSVLVEEAAEALKNTPTIMCLFQALRCMQIFRK